MTSETLVVRLRALADRCDARGEVESGPADALGWFNMGAMVRMTATMVLRGTWVEDTGWRTLWSCQDVLDTRGARL